MAEGGRFPWKMQKLMTWGPVADYRNLRDPLPRPPAGMVWKRDDQTREWSLVLEAEQQQQQQQPQPQPQQQQQQQQLLLRQHNGVTPENLHKPDDSMATEASTAMSAASNSNIATNNSNNSSSSNKPPLVVATGSMLPPRKPGDMMPDLVEEQRTSFVVNLPPAGFVRRESGSSHNINGMTEDEWELLSEKMGSNGASNTSTAAYGMAKAGSVRSISSMEQHSQQSSSYNTTLSVPFKIQRTASSSTIDSCDNALGPSGLGVLGVDYVEHVVLPTDTLQGICLAYKINTTRLRQANHFSGNSLLLAPKKLVIPLSKKALRSGFIRVQDTDAKEYKLHAFLAEFPALSMTEAKAYLELGDWKLQDAIKSARDDGEWERDMTEEDDEDNNVHAGQGKGMRATQRQTPLSPGEIRFTKGPGGGWSPRGAGIVPSSSSSSPQRPSVSKVQPSSPKVQMGYDEEAEAGDHSMLSTSNIQGSCNTSNKQNKRVVTPCGTLPAIATKTVNAEDLYRASQQHDNFGFELKSIPPKNTTTSTGEDEQILSTEPERNT